MECFKELRVWQMARHIRQRIYEITSGFPAQERYNLTGQMRSAAVSMTSNIAEGFGRRSRVENRRFCRISRGSAFELRDQLQTGLDEKYVTQNAYEELEDQLLRFIRALNAYISTMTVASEESYRSYHGKTHQETTRLRNQKATKPKNQQTAANRRPKQ